jgi:hypothetical protein
MNFQIRAYFLSTPDDLENINKIFLKYCKGFHPGEITHETDGSSGTFVSLKVITDKPEKIMDKIAKAIVKHIGGEDPHVFMYIVRLDEHPADKYLYRKGINWSL